MSVSVGELFILGFYGKTVPDWLRSFAARYGLGGVILFDYSIARANTTTTSSRPNKCGVCARRLQPCRRHRWCSSTRKVGWCGG